MSGETLPTSVRHRCSDLDLENPDVQQKRYRNYLRFLVAVFKPEGISQRRWDLIQRLIEPLRGADRADFHPSSGTGMRRAVRYLACLIPDDVDDDDVPDHIYAMIRGGNLLPSDVHDICAGSYTSGVGGEPDACTLRRIARRLTEPDVDPIGNGGPTYADIADQHDVGVETVSKVAQWLDITGAEEERLFDAACVGILEHGWTNEQYAARMDVSMRQAKKFMKEARTHLRQANLI